MKGDERDQWMRAGGERQIAFPYMICIFNDDGLLGLCYKSHDADPKGNRFLAILTSCFQ